MKYITKYLCHKKHKGYIIKFKINKSETYRKLFKFVDFKDPLEEARKFRDSDQEIKELLNLKNKLHKSPNMTVEESFDWYMKKYNIKSFPAVINRTKLIGIDKIDRNFVFIKECRFCKKHVNVLVLTENFGTELCNSCAQSTKKRKDHVRGFEIIQRGKEYYKIRCKIDVLVFGKIENVFRLEKMILKKNVTEKFINDYTLYFNFLLYEFIELNNLKFDLPITEIEYNRVKKLIMSNQFAVNFKKPFINNMALSNYKLRKHLHIFKAKIQGFGTNKKDESKTVLLNEVEYVGIDNFRDHMWTSFSKQLDLPVGTTIKFKGEIYDYEREYLGIRDVDKNGQSIKIIELLEVDLSTRERVKLYK